MDAEQLMNTIRAFQESRAILTGVELDVFTVVGSAATAEAVAGKIEAHPRSTEMLLNALTACGLLTKSGGLYRNTEVSAQYLTGDGRLATLHSAHLWHTWSTLTEAVRAGTSVRPPAPEPRDAAWTEAFIAAMHRNALERAPLVARAIGLDGVRRMLDVGGGSGAYSIAFAKANPSITADVLDLEAVAAIARRHIEAANVSGRVRTRVGDLRSDNLGEDYDLVFVSAICHMLSEDENRDLLRRCHAACAPGGRVVIQEFILEADKSGPKVAALFALNMLVGTRAGSSYSNEEYSRWLLEAGFGDVRHVRLPGPTGLMVGTRS
jgi:predicted O-methyltransferase YrrM